MTSLKLLRVYFVIFAAALIGLLAFIAGISSSQITRETDGVLSWQLRYLRLIPDAELADAIRTRLAYGQLHIHYYGLFDPNGKHIAGDILAIPARLPAWPNGESLEHTLTVSGIERSPVVRIMDVRRSDGRILLVGVDMTNVLAVHRIVVTLLIAGGAMGLLLSAGVGIAVGIREMKRIDQVRHAASLIGQGDLSRRFQTGGRDEIAMLLDVINHMLDEVERLMGEVKGVCDGIAHDLRTPLARVRTLLTRAAERSGSLQQRQLSEMLDQAQHETDVVLARFAAMLRVAQIAGLSHHDGFDLVDLRMLVADVGGLYAPLAESRGMTLTASAEDSAPVRADRALVFEMLGNLMAHVLSRAPSGANVRIVLAMTERGPRLAIDSDRWSIAEVPALEAGRSRDASAAGDRTSLSVAWAVARMHGFALRAGHNEPGFTVDCWPQMSLSF